MFAALTASAATATAVFRYQAGAAVANFYTLVPPRCSSLAVEELARAGFVMSQAEAMTRPRLGYEPREKTSHRVSSFG